MMSGLTRAKSVELFVAGAAYVDANSIIYFEFQVVLTTVFRYATVLTVFITQ
jgi:hypothetical protein